MEFKDITTWTVTADHKARPKNHYAEFGVDAQQNPYLNKDYIDFERFVKDHTYHTDETLKPGEYPAESVKLQRLCMYSWNQPNYVPVSEEWYQDMKDSSENKFKTQLELLVDIEVLQNNQWTQLKITQSEINEFKRVNRWFRYPGDTDLPLKPASKEPEVKQQGGEWISVEDGYPTHERKVRAIITYGNGRMEEIHTNYVKRIECFDSFFTDQITHWQEIVLPSPSNKFNP